MQFVKIVVYKNKVVAFFSENKIKKKIKKKRKA